MIVHNTIWLVVGFHGLLGQVLAQKYSAKNERITSLSTSQIKSKQTMAFCPFVVAKSYSPRCKWLSAIHV